LLIQFPYFNFVGMGYRVSHTEKLLLRQLCAGDVTAFDFFFHTFKQSVYREMRSMIRVEALAEEMTREIFVRVWERRNDISDRQSFAAYLYRIKQDVLFAFYRKMALDNGMQDAISATYRAEYNRTEGRVFLKETQDTLTQAIAGLTDQQRTIYTLCRLEGKSYEEVARRIGVSAHTVRQQMVNASNKVRDFMLK
jgi:RNA polymerase sigma factor (sigma-70 family)